MAKDFNSAKNKEDMQLAFLYHVGSPLMNEDQITKAKQVLNREAKVGDLLTALDIPLNSLQKQYSLIAKQLDVTQWIISHKFHVTEEEWSKAEEEVIKENEIQKQEVAKEFTKKLKQITKENQAGISDDVKKNPNKVVKADFGTKK